MASTQKMDLFPSAASVSVAAVNGETMSLPPRAKQLIGHINVSAINAATTVTALIQHSPDGIKWYTYLAFTAIAAAINSEAIYPANQPVFPYVRSTFTLTGGTKSATVDIKLYFENVS